MKILFFYQYFGTPKGSWSTRVYEFTKRWVIEGHEVTVVTAPYDKSDIKCEGFISRQTVEGINLIVINSGDSNRLSIYKRAWKACVFATISVFYALSLRYDIVISSSGPITTGLPMIFAKMLRRKSTVFEVRDLWPRGGIELGVIHSALTKKIAFWIERLCYRSAKLIVACSEGMAKDILYRFPDRNIVVVPNACDVELFKTTEKFIVPDFIQGRKIIVYAGSLGLMDDCSQIVQAAGVLSARGYNQAVIVFIGDGAERAMLEEHARDRGLKNLIFLGLVPKTEVVKWLSVAEASIVVFKNVDVLNTSSPNKFFDSLAAGVPVIQTTQGWIKDVVDREKLGINVMPNNANEMADAIINMIKNHEIRNVYALNALKAARNLFNRDRLAKNMLNEMKSINNIK